MIEKIKYINHLNEELSFGELGIYANQSDIHDFAWGVVSQNEKISSFVKGIQEKGLPIVISESADTMAVRNTISEITEKDVLAVKPGRLVIGDYYMYCYVTGSTKEGYLNGDCIFNLKIATDRPYWIKETISSFAYGQGEAGTDMDYESDFDYDYSSNLLSSQLVNGNFVPTNFKMQIYGPATNPAVTIGGHTYKVNKSVETNQYLIIDSIEKTIELIKQDGTKENCFNKRDKESYIFEKMPIGISNVSTSAAFNFDITLLEERSEPKWI